MLTLQSMWAGMPVWCAHACMNLHGCAAKHAQCTRPFVTRHTRACMRARGAGRCACKSRSRKMWPPHAKIILYIQFSMHQRPFNNIIHIEDSCAHGGSILRVFAKFTCSEYVWKTERINKISSARQGISLHGIYIIILLWLCRHLHGGTRSFGSQTQCAHTQNFGPEDTLKKPFFIDKKIIFNYHWFNLCIFCMTREIFPILWKFLAKIYFQCLMCCVSKWFVVHHTGI